MWSKKENSLQKTPSSQNSTEDPSDLSTAQKTPVISQNFSVTLYLAQE